MLTLCLQFPILCIYILRNTDTLTSAQQVSGLKNHWKKVNQLLKTPVKKAEPTNDTRNFLNNRCWYQNSEEEKDKFLSCYRSSKGKTDYEILGLSDGDNYEEQYEKEADKFFNFTMGDRIINGVNADYKSHPWMVYIETKPPGASDNDAEMCGGTLLSSKTVLTAKHCVFKKCVGVIKYGAADKTKAIGQVKFKCGSDLIIVHEECDLAIIKTKKKLGGRPINIPKDETEHPKDGDSVYAVGWGRACASPGAKCPKQDRRPAALQMSRIKVSENCIYTSSDPFLFCAGGMMGKLPKDACSGDSGGPLECRDKDGKMFQCGVVSQGPASPNCGRKPGAYVKLANPDIIDWLKKIGQATTGPRLRTDVDRNSKRKLSDSRSVHHTSYCYSALVFNAVIIYRLSMGSLATLLQYK